MYHVCSKDNFLHELNSCEASKKSSVNLFIKENRMFFKRNYLEKSSLIGFASHHVLFASSQSSLRLLFLGSCIGLSNPSACCRNQPHYLNLLNYIFDNIA